MENLSSHLSMCAIILMQQLAFQIWLLRNSVTEMHFLDELGFATNVIKSWIDRQALGDVACWVVAVHLSWKYFMQCQ